MFVQVVYCEVHLNITKLKEWRRLKWEPCHNMFLIPSWSEWENTTSAIVLRTLARRLIFNELVIDEFNYFYYPGYEPSYNNYPFVYVSICLCNRILGLFFQHWAKIYKLFSIDLRFKGQNCFRCQWTPTIYIRTIGCKSATKFLYFLVL